MKDTGRSTWDWLVLSLLTPREPLRDAAKFVIETGMLMDHMLGTWMRQPYDGHDLECALDLFSRASLGVEFPKGRCTLDVNAVRMGPMQWYLTRGLSTDALP